MHIHISPACRLMIFAFNLVFIVKALPASHFTPTDDEPNSLLPDKELRSRDFGLSLLNSHVFNSGTYLHNSQDFPDHFALASASTDDTGSLFHDFDRPGADISSSRHEDLFGDLGLPSDSDDFSFADHTLAFNDPGSDPTNQAASPDLFAKENPGDSISASSSSSASLLTPDDNPLSDDFTILDSVNPGEGTVLGDDTALSAAHPVDVSLAPEDDSLFDHEGSAADVSLLGDDSTTNSVNSAEDTSSSVPGDTKGTLIASASKITAEGSTTPPSCSGQKTPACCLSAKAESGLTLPGYKSGCISCMCFSGISDR